MFSDLEIVCNLGYAIKTEKRENTDQKSFNQPKKVFLPIIKLRYSISSINVNPGIFLYFVK